MDKPRPDAARHAIRALIAFGLGLCCAGTAGLINAEYALSVGLFGAAAVLLAGGYAMRRRLC